MGECSNLLSLVFNILCFLDCMHLCIFNKIRKLLYVLQGLKHIGVGAIFLATIRWREDLVGGFTCDSSLVWGLAKLICYDILWRFCRVFKFVILLKFRIMLSYLNMFFHCSYTSIVVGRYILGSRGLTIISDLSICDM